MVMGGCRHGRNAPSRVSAIRLALPGGDSVQPASTAGRSGSIAGQTGRQCCAEIWRQQFRAEAMSPPTSAELRSEEHTSELQSRGHLVCRLLLEKKKKSIYIIIFDRRTAR